MKTLLVLRIALLITWVVGSIAVLMLAGPISGLTFSGNLGYFNLAIGQSTYTKFSGIPKMLVIWMWLALTTLPSLFGQSLVGYCVGIVFVFTITLAKSGKPADLQLS